jgi:hypothetical protein
MTTRQFWQQEAAFIKDTSAILSAVDGNLPRKQTQTIDKKAIGKSSFYISGDGEKSAKLAKCDILGMLDPISRRSVEIIFEEHPLTKNYFKVLMKDNTGILPGGTEFGQGYLLLKNLITSKNVYLYKVEKLNGDDNGVKNLSKSKRDYRENSFTGQDQSRTYKKHYYEPFDILENKDDFDYINNKINSDRYSSQFSQIKNINASSINILVNRAKDSLKSLNIKHIKEKGIKDTPVNLGVAGEVTIDPNGEWYFPRQNLELIIPRIDIVFHELWECWERTDNFEPYGYSFMNEPYKDEDEVDRLFKDKTTSERRAIFNNSGKIVNSSNGTEPALSDKIPGAHEKANQAAENDKKTESVKQPGTIRVRYVVESKSVPTGFCENIMTWDRAKEAQEVENRIIKDKNGVQYELRL